ncbi:MAG TPA: energy transducer TonB [Oxalobacteraceae bacterium]|jgi:protein TonB|nr:energy transducer TonB [Oxalobacteraceae bacterium]
MEFSEYERNPGKKFTGIAFVIFLHVFIIYALVTGLARKVVEVIKQPIETKIIEEVKPPPPPDLPPPPPPPKLLAPPPPFIPPPEVQIQQPPQQNTITAVSNVKPDNPVMPAVVRETPATSQVLVPAVVDARNCEKPEYPRKSLRNEETGTVTLQFLIGLDGHVVESKILKSSGSRDLDNAARAGLSLCKFTPGTVDGKPQQSWTKMQYVWKLE